MTSHLDDSYIAKVGNVLYSPTATSGVLHTSSGRSTSLDSVQYNDSDQAQAKKASGQSTPGTRVALPPPKSSPEADYLLAVAKAFCTAFTAMGNGIITQTKDYAELQGYDQTQAQATLQSTTDAINKENKADMIASQVNEYAKKAAKVEKIFGYVMLGLGIAILVGTFITTIVSGGATAAALPEETSGLIELTEMTSSSMEDVVPDTTDSLSNTTDSSSSEDIDSEEDESDPSQFKAMDDMMSDSSNSIENPTQETEETVTRDLDENNSENTKSQSKLSRVAKGFGKVGLRVVTGAGFASPMLMKGIYDTKIGDKLEEVKSAQQTVGKALEVLQLNNTFYQFMQQLVQREGGVLTEQANDASEVVETYGDIMNAYKGITYSLANSV